MSHALDATSTHRVELLHTHFFNRTDVLAGEAPWGAPCPISRYVSLESVLAAHVGGTSVPGAKVAFRARERERWSAGFFRIGAYTPGPDSRTRWLCIDFDGKGHSAPLSDPTACALASMRALADLGLPAHLERSGGGLGWHVWVFFESPVPAELAQRIGLHVVPQDALLEHGGFADARASKGIEVFPKVCSLSPGGLGNAVWLPFWWQAPTGANVFYELRAGDTLAEVAVPVLVVAHPEDVERVSASLPDPEPGYGVGRFSAIAMQRGRAFDSGRKQRREEVLRRLPLEAVYGPWLTGKVSGRGWLECRDPHSPSGDQHPSAGVADGEGMAERGTFHSHRTGETHSVFDFMVQNKLARDFPDAVRKVEEMGGVQRPRSLPAGTSDAKLPNIAINVDQVRDTTAQAWHALLRRNADRPRVFEQGGRLVRLHHSETVRIAAHDQNTLSFVLGRCANWGAISHKGDFVPRPVPKEVIQEMLAKVHPKVPKLDAITMVPVLGSDGAVIQDPGYHLPASLWYEPSRGFEMPVVPPIPTDADVNGAKALLLDQMVGEFPFAGQSDKASFLAALVTPFLRTLFVGNAPAILITAPTPGSGKSLLADVISLIVTGETSRTMTLPPNEDAAKRLIFAALLSGWPIHLFDNLTQRKTLDSQALASALTSLVVTERLYYKDEVGDVKNRALWLMTGNNPSLSNELARRVVSCRLVPATDKPWLEQRSIADLRGWVKAHRGELVRAVLVLGRAWLTRGKPMGAKGLGSFEGWARVVGGVLEVAGVSGFLEDQDRFYEEVDVETDMWLEFVQYWLQHNGGAPMQVQELARMCRTGSLMEALVDFGEERIRSASTKLGLALKRLRGMVIGGHRVERMKRVEAHNGSSFYRVVKL